MKKRNTGLLLIVLLFLLAGILGILVFKNYTQSAKFIMSSLVEMQKKAPDLTIEGCAENVITWYAHCDAMQQMCEDTVPRMTKVCLSNGSKELQCKKYGTQIHGYNFGFEECVPYLKNRFMKKACADTWQAVADYCKAVEKVK